MGPKAVKGVNGVIELIPAAAVSDVDLSKVVRTSSEYLQVDGPAGAIDHGVGHGLGLVSCIQYEFVNLMHLVVQFGVVVWDLGDDFETAAVVVRQMIGLEVVGLVLDEVDGSRSRDDVVVMEIIPVDLGLVGVYQRRGR